MSRKEPPKGWNEMMKRTREGYYRKIESPRREPPKGWNEMMESTRRERQAKREMEEKKQKEMEEIRKKETKEYWREQRKARYHHMTTMGRLLNNPDFIEDWFRSLDTKALIQKYKNKE